MVLLLCHESENPIKKWKKIIGNLDPVEAKVNFFLNNFLISIIQKLDPTCLRAVYGQTILKNEFHGSDSPFDSNKEREIFKFAIP